MPFGWQGEVKKKKKRRSLEGDIAPLLFPPCNIRALFNCCLARGVFVEKQDRKD